MARRHFRWVVLAAGVLGAAAMVGDLVWISARYWPITLPVFVLCVGLAYWSLGPAADAPKADATMPMPVRLLASVFVVAAGVVALAVLLFLLQLALENLWVSIPFALVAGLLLVMALWPERRRRRRAKPTRSVPPPASPSQPETIVSGDTPTPGDIVS